VFKYSNLPEEIVGLDAYKEYDKTTRTAFPDFKMSIDEFFVKDNKIFCYWAVVATNTGPLMTPMGEIPATNKKVHISGLAVSTIVDGKIKKDVAYFDMLSMMQQLGFKITPPQTETAPEK
jgi:steroid delta-isomerase-like uncharacterized protein